MELSPKEVEHVANLAKINLTDKEKEDHGKKLSKILAYFEELKKVDIKNVSDVGQITGLTNQLSEDRVSQCEISRENLLSNAPIIKDGYVKVKSVLGRET